MTSDQMPSEPTTGDAELQGTTASETGKASVESDSTKRPTSAGAIASSSKFDYVFDDAENSDEAEGFEHDDIPSVADALGMIDEAEGLFKQKNYEGAAELSSTAVATLSATYGDGAPECAAALQLYGMALYHVAAERGSIFAGKEEPTVLDPEAAEAAAAALAEMMKKGASRFVFQGDGDDEVLTSEETPKGNATNSASGSSSKAGPSASTDVGADDADNIDDLELAYEILTVAATAYLASPSDDNMPKLAEVYLYLGHYHLENDRPEEASAEYAKCLDLKLHHLNSSPTRTREIAAARYFYSITLEATGKYDSAREQVQLSIEAVQERLDALKQTMTNGGVQAAGSDKGKDKASSSAHLSEVSPAEEIQELSELKLDLEAKSEELANKKAQLAEASAILRSNLEGESSSSAPKADGASTRPASSGPVTDISSLVKKRKASPASTQDADVSKKLKTEETTGEK
ncbi:uncharacterized protein EV422DRAFT_515071 [Fimicolochytrium jonesii]|uniref:uncharacterized protein n=1 Tax=Fimicolochytrium jonesii TaxID=1396493 RepID=UPI0022FE895A|nr:uncharacterized protein EV422DRAFT_515071 [Fimicolochytrium jonesii]KAI8826036.1 hypothetical protein EV422DRAFT_515071 [Fimicolochytrium jonesii]